jgi:hypothetical protein
MDPAAQVITLFFNVFTVGANFFIASIFYYSTLAPDCRGCSNNEHRFNRYVTPDDILAERRMFPAYRSKHIVHLFLSALLCEKGKAERPAVIQA